MRGFFLVAFLALASVSMRADPLDGDMLSAESVAAKSVHAFLTSGDDGKPTTKFSTGAEKISASWKGSGLKAGDRLRAVWIAENIGVAERNDSKITEAVVTTYKPDDDGTFALGRPKEGWPVGKYRLELYINNKLSETLRFTIESGATIEVGRDSN